MIPVDLSGECDMDDHLEGVCKGLASFYRAEEFRLLSSGSCDVIYDPDTDEEFFIE